MFYLVTGSDSGTGILVRRRQPSVLCERMRHQRCCPCTGGECGGACSKSKGQFQKVAAFHDIFLSVRASDAERVSPRRDERSVNRESQLQRAITPPGRHRGVAVVDNLGSFNAQVAEISIDKGKVRVHRVVCAVDCGYVVNPAIVVQQIESGIVYGLSAALRGEITIDRGRVQQSNFNNYEPLRIDEMPVIETYIVPSTNPPGGIGEASTPAIAPAVTNAVFSATGKRIRRLPIKPEDLV